MLQTTYREPQYSIRSEKPAVEVIIEVEWTICLWTVQTLESAEDPESLGPDHSSRQLLGQHSPPKLIRHASNVNIPELFISLKRFLSRFISKSYVHSQDCLELVIRGTLFQLQNKDADMIIWNINTSLSVPQDYSDQIMKTAAFFVVLLAGSASAAQSYSDKSKAILASKYTSTPDDYLYESKCDATKFKSCDYSVWHSQWLLTIETLLRPCFGQQYCPCRNRWKCCLFQI